MTQEELIFRKTDLKRARLMDALNVPEVQEAFAILTQVPSKEPPFVPGVPLDTTVAHEYFKMLGANQVLKGLVRMTHPPGASHEEQEIVEEQPWGWAEQTVQPMSRPVVPAPEAPASEPATVKKSKKKK